MKKIFIATIAFLISNLCIAQFTFVDGDDNEIPNNTEVIFGTANHPSASFPFRIINTSDDPINVKIKCTNIINSNGSNFQVCFGGTCYDNIMVNGVYPDYDFIINPGEDNGTGDYFKNNNVTESEVLTFQFSIYAVGFEDEALTFTYKYDPQLSVDDTNKLGDIGIQINNTIVKNTLVFETQESGIMEVYDLNGRLVKKSSYNAGIQNVDFNEANAAIYVVKFHTTLGNVGTIKIVKQ
jgi:hypothetical protein